MVENDENEDPGFLFAVFVSGHKVILENEDDFQASSRTYKSKNGDFIAYDQLFPGRKILKWKKGPRKFFPATVEKQPLTEPGYKKVKSLKDQSLEVLTSNEAANKIQKNKRSIEDITRVLRQKAQEKKVTEKEIISKKLAEPAPVQKVRVPEEKKNEAKKDSTGTKEWLQMVFNAIEARLQGHKKKKQTKAHRQECEAVKKQIRNIKKMHSMGIVAPLVVRQEATHLLLEVYPKEIRQIEGFFIDTSPDFSAEQLAFMTKELAKRSPSKTVSSNSPKNDELKKNNKN
ncbi:Oidioi.mRNA.OKI2018_I69.chr1.g2272.t1.cds [Oikopleura dioica]|uniref:Oidioi.mRNA.OKI2018_I69.chr1.g2272.t1.cds n=1 Tax=Oikopleura dioica TaxID=34765 RepID=A0ABN7SVS8_OIKDI|nr:Oidioi.mRNA.OKI2018_I69.chr1.g2272.t1.cds [Oikopleura dioica]